MKSISKNMMICPCCGSERSLAAQSCAHCQAREIGEPLVQPEYKLPSLGPAFAALFAVGLIAVVFVGAWLLLNDMKVIRVALVTLLGDSTLFTKSLLQGDPDLLRYRIFTFDAYRLACLLSFGAVPVSIYGIYLARRARKLYVENPLKFGGGRLAQTSLVLAACFLVLFSSAGISSIPRAIQNSRAKHIAATHSQLYHLHVQELQKFYAENGTYPQELEELGIALKDNIQQFDYWGGKINYTPTALLASKNSAPVFSNYQLVSPGPDGVMGTPDDIRMIDGVIVSSPENDDPITGFVTDKSNNR